MGPMSILRKTLVSIAIPLILAILSTPSNATPDYWGCEGPAGAFGLFSGLLMAIQMKMANSEVTKNVPAEELTLNLSESYIAVASK